MQREMGVDMDDEKEQKPELEFYGSFKPLLDMVMAQIDTEWLIDYVRGVAGSYDDMTNDKYDEMLCEATAAQVIQLVQEMNSKTIIVKPVMEHVH